MSFSTTTEAPDLFGDAAAATRRPSRLPKRVGELIELVVCHRDPERYALLYRLVWRILHGERALLDVAERSAGASARPDGAPIRRDLHKMHAFVRFRRVDGEDANASSPGSSPSTSSWRRRRRSSSTASARLDWTILTPIGSMRWDRERLDLRPARAAADAPTRTVSRRAGATITRACSTRRG